MFAHDTEDALTSAAALANTADDPDALTTPEELDAFVEEWGWTGSRAHDRAELEEVHRLRQRLREVWVADVETMVDQVNSLLREARAVPQLVRHDGYDWHIHAATAEQPLATRMAVEAAMGLVDVIRAGETERLKVCAAPDCGSLVIDLSKNRSKRYCEGGCGNRLAAAAYRARQAGDG